jgi:hypothetical protein
MHLHFVLTQPESWNVQLMLHSPFIFCLLTFPKVIRGIVSVYSLIPHRDIVGLRDVTDNDMAEDHLISHSNESKVLTLEDTSIDQQEFDDTFPYVPHLYIDLANSVYRLSLDLFSSHGLCVERVYCQSLREPNV